MKTNLRMWAVACAIVTSGVLCGTVVCAPEAQDERSQVVTLHGRVLNKLTNEPIARALVTSNGNEYATLTNDRGQFTFNFTASPQQGNFAGSRLDRMAIAQAVNSHFFQAQKPGFLDANRHGPMAFQSMVVQKDGTSDITIYLLPEALITGHVNVQGSEGDVRINCELYRRTVRDGRINWSPAGTFTTWADGEFRFSDLEPGTYKLITHEQMDFESRIPMPGAPLFGYPPIYYPNTTDFSAASPLVVHAGETAQLNLTVARRQYYPVHIPVANPPASAGINLNVYPMGHHSPGWSLGYNPSNQAIQGMLPDGNYTVEADGFGEQRSFGMVNFSVNGAPSESAPLRLIPETPLTVTVREEFAGQQGDAVPTGQVVITPGGHGGRAPSVHLTLVPWEEFDSFRGYYQARPTEGSEDNSLVFENVRPGRYKVRAMARRGYAASIQSGGSDLLHQPLVVGPGGGNPPIEVTLRDDGGEVSGTLEEKGSDATSQPRDPNSSFRTVYLLPLGDSLVQSPPMAQFQGEEFTLQQVPPGSYLLLAYSDAPADLPYGSDDAMERLKSQGQIIQVEAGQKIRVRARIATEGEGQ